MNLIYLRPTDVLFFRDGRPMGGSLAGHSAAWPLPDVTNHALHAALHRADLEKQTGQKVHEHQRGRSGQYSTDVTHRDRKFGSLLTAGPFPVRVEKGSAPATDATWFFPRPKDTQVNGSVRVTLLPVRSLTKDGNDDPWLGSSLPDPLEYAVANTEPPSKDTDGEPWISRGAFDAYLGREGVKSKPADGVAFLRDTALADTEQQIGIGINPVTGTVAESQFYSAHYLRLREGFQLGLIAEAMDKLKNDGSRKRDLIQALLSIEPAQIVVGGQQRICTAERREAGAALPLPLGLAAGFKNVGEPNQKRWLVKWVLLSPALWPEIPAKKKNGSDQNWHPGGWLPNWVFVNWNGETREPKPDERNGEVLLTSGSGIRKAARKGTNVGARIAARLVAAIVPKPIPVTGWALANDSDRAEGGAKSTHLAVPAGAVYYFEANSEKDATTLASALNWHGSTNGAEIKNRRSTLMGEKGFGLGVCGTWEFYENVAGRPTT